MDPAEPKSRGTRAEIARIRRKPLPDEVAARLRQLISDGNLRPGTRMYEKPLSEQLGVSRTPLREAFKVLATEGLLEIVPHRGAIIATLTLRDLDHMFTVLGALEALAGELACSNISEGALEEIRVLHEKMFKCHAARKRVEYFRINQSIHERIIDAAGNPVLSSVYASLSGRIRHARYTPAISDAAWAQGAKDHEMILAALVARDSGRLNRILTDHLRHKRDGVKAALAPRAGKDWLSPEPALAAESSRGSESAPLLR
ncbi:MAG: GntR family transcriptional regulator [Burkholderiales bacterium]|nr:GntR family transcriptional regulator [Burkholderiales bacterium]